MKAPPFGYVRAGSLADVFRLWSDAGPDAKLLAGGQSLLATLAFRLSEPSTLVDISRVPELQGITDAGAAIRVGAATSHTALGSHALILQHVPLIAQAVPRIAHPAIRNRGTIGGSLAFADPAAELPTCVVTLEATIIAQSAKGQRRIPATEFFRGLYQTALAEGELIAAVELPKAKPDQRHTIVQLERRTGDYAMAGVAARAVVEAGVLRDPRLVFFGVGEMPVLAKTAMAKAAGLPVTPETLSTITAALYADLDPSADLHGSPAMKRHWCRVLLKRALMQISQGSEAAAT